MARKGHGRPASLVNIGTHPDDTSSPVGSNEWNANRDTTGIIGFTKKTEPIDGSNNINITDSYVEVTNAGTIYTMSQVTTALSSTNYASDTTTKSFAEGDLLYLVKATAGHTITLKNQQGGAGAGKITTLSGGDLLLSTTVPRIFICRTIGSYQEWIEYGGGAVTTPTDITVEDTTDTTCFPALFESVTGDLEPKTDAGLAYNAGNATLTATTFVGALTGNASTSSSTSGNAATATLASTVTITDNEATNETNAIVFTAGGDVDGGNLGLESDGNLTYNPSTGTIAATIFSGTDVVLSGRLKADKGVNVASGTNTTLGDDGNTFRITGTTDIVTIVTTNWSTGNVIHLNFAGVLTVTDGTGAGAIRLGDQDDMTTAAEDTLSLFYNGTEWVEISRSTVGGAGLGGSATAHISFGGVYSIHDLQTLFLEHQSSGFDDSGNDRGDESQLFVKYEDANNDGLYIRLRVNGNTQNVKIA